MNRIYLQLFAEEGEPKNGDGQNQAEPGNNGSKQNQAEPGKQGGTQGNDNGAGGAPAKYTDDDLNRIIAAKKAEWIKKKDAEVDEAKKLADMNAQQKAEYERDKYQKELAEYKAREALSKMSSTARKMLAEQDISIADDVIAMLVSTDAEKTNAAIKGFTEAFNNAVAAAVKKKLGGKEPRTGSEKHITKDDILKIKDPAARQQAIAENIELFGGKK